MRMKEGHTLNRQLKPDYNAQISSENQIIVHYTLHQNPTDTKTLKPHLENFEQLYGEKALEGLEEITADPGYGSEENYDYLEQKQLTAFVKYNTFDKEQDRGINKNTKHLVKKIYTTIKKKDLYICPMGQPMEKTHQSKPITVAGYEQNLSHYQAQNCNGCPLRGQCYQAKANRSTIELNHNLERRKEQARKLLLSEQGIQKRKQRTADVEPVLHNSSTIMVLDDFL